MSEKTETLADGIQRELKRNREILFIYKGIPAGAFGATMIESLIVDTERAMLEGDLPKMITCYQKLKESE